MEGVLHYVVDHTPSLFYKTFTWDNSQVIYPYINQLVAEDIGTVLKDSLIIDNGRIVDKEIIEFQKR